MFFKPNLTQLTGYHLQLPDETRTSIIFHLETLSGVAKGLTRTSDSLNVLEDDSDPDSQCESEIVKAAREDPRAAKLRENIYDVIRGVVEIWSLDAAVSHVRYLQSRSRVLRSNMTEHRL